MRTTRGRPTMSHRAIPSPFFWVHTGRATSAVRTRGGRKNDGGNKGGAFREANRGFWGITLRSVPVSFPVAAILFLLTFVLGVPTAAWFAVKVLRKPIAVTAGLSLMILLGVVGPFAGPFGLPKMVAWGVACAFSVTFGYAFAMVTANAWSAALAASDRIRVERDGERGLERE